MRVLSSKLPVETAAPQPVRTARSFNAEQRSLEILQDEFTPTLPPADVPDSVLNQTLADLEAWVAGYPSLYEPLADAKSMYSEEELKKLPQNLAALIAGFCVKMFEPVRDRIGDRLWNYWKERSYR